MINLIVALQCEAKPLIQHYGLKGRSVKSPRLKNSMGGDAFRVYEKDDLVLTVSGVGKIAAAAAVAYTHMLFDAQDHCAWLNIGVAGHADLPLGTGVLAQKISDAGTGLNWYPPHVFDPECATGNIITVDRPQTEYAQRAFFDMEASGFYATASRFVTSELVQSYKVVSDNRTAPAEQVSEQTVRSVIERNLSQIDFLINQLWKLTGQLRDIHTTPELFDRICNRWHFTQYQQGVLQQLIKRLDVLAPEQVLWTSELEQQQNAHDVLLFLQNILDTLPVELKKTTA
jgi:adenosylhomocysteine nucleosidase